jgi:hypothetical protein
MIYIKNDGKDEDQRKKKEPWEGGFHFGYTIDV